MAIVFFALGHFAGLLGAAVFLVFGLQQIEPAWGHDHTLVFLVVLAIGCSVIAAAVFRVAVAALQRGASRRSAAALGFASAVVALGVVVTLHRLGFDVRIGSGLLAIAACSALVAVCARRRTAT